jgi:hypothetical protein
MDKVTGQYRKAFIITGAEPASIESELYSEDLMEKAVATMNANENAKKDFGDGGEEDWGSGKIEGKKDESSDDAW